MFAVYQGSDLDVGTFLKRKGEGGLAMVIKASGWVWKGTLIWSPFRITAVNEIQRLIDMNILEG